MRKAEIERCFYNLRLHHHCHRACPYDKREDCPAFEMDHLAEAKDRIEDYLLRELQKTERPGVAIDWAPARNAVEPGVAWRPERRQLHVFYKNEDRRHKERVAIAVTMAKIVMDFLPLVTLGRRHKPTSPFALAYFAEKLLNYYAPAMTGSVLKQTYTLTPHGVEHELRLLYRGYSQNRLEHERKSQIDTLFEQIFPAPAEDDEESMPPILQVEIAATERWLQKKFSVDARGKKRNIRIQLNPSVGIRGTHGGKLLCGRDHCIIAFPVPANILSRIPESGLTLDARRAWSIARLIVAHELGHIVIHGTRNEWPIVIGKNESDEDKREAAYYARLLLERREWIYANKKDTPAYREACAYIHETMELYHDAPWVEEVYDERISW